MAKGHQSPFRTWNNSYIGKIYGYLTILGLSGKRTKVGSLRVICKCICGKIIEPEFYRIRKLNQTSCGCKRNFKHGFGAKRFYGIWNSIIHRCNNQGNKAYKWYGGRGIAYDEGWNDFLEFKKDMYQSYVFAKRKHRNILTKDNPITIERKDVNGNYNKENCIWIPLEEQNLNKTNVFPIKAVNIKTGAEIFGISQNDLARKLNISQASISLCIMGKRESLCGWKFKQLSKKGVNK